MNELIDKFLTIQGWMLDLGLSNNELMCFAVINGFSQDDESMMKGGLSYLQKWLNVSRPTVISILKKLLDKGYIERTEVILRDGKHVFYRVVKNFNQGRLNILTKVSKETLSSNINKEIYKGKEEKRLSNDNQKKEDISFEDFYKLYPLKKSRKPSETKWNSLSVKDKKAAIGVLPRYIADCISHKRSFKYPATYLNQRTWEDDFTPVEAEEQENNNQPEELPAGLDATTWDKFRAWGEKAIPRIINDISPEDYVKMLGMAHLSKSVMIDILKELNEGEYEGDLLGHYDSLRESPAYWHRIIGGNSHDTETGD